MPRRYFEDFFEGLTVDLGNVEFTAEGIIDFARQYDPQPMHTDPDAARESVYGGLIASGWHTAAMTMRLFVQTLNFAEGAIGLGVDELRWPRVVRPGDVLTVETEIVDLRPSRSRPNHGIIRLRNVTTNQRGEIVQTMLASAMVPRRAGKQRASKA